MLKHVLIIPDGNRRWAKERNISFEKLYKLAANVTTPKVIKYFLVDKKLPELSIFMISRSNVLNRDKKELESILKAQVDGYENWLNNPVFEEAKIKFRFVGETDLLPDYYKETMDKLTNTTKDNTGSVCNLLVAYDGRWELLQAMGKIQANGNSVPSDPEELTKYMAITRPIDLVIRTGKEKRLSTCPLPQVAYAEFCYCDYHYPEFTLPKLDGIVRDYVSRDRRMGR